MKRVLFTDL